MLDHFAVVWRKLTGNLLERFFSFMGWKVAPVTSVIEIFASYLARSLASGSPAVVHRPTPTTPTSPAACPARLSLLLLLLLNLGDQFVKGFDDPILNCLRAGPRQTKIEATGDVPHPTGDVIKRLVFQRPKICLHQPGQPLIPHRDGFGLLEQTIERSQSGLSIEQPVLAGGAVKQERGRVAGSLHGEGLQKASALIKEAMPHQLPAVKERHHVVELWLIRGLVEPAGVGRFRTLCSRHKARRPRIQQSHACRTAVEAVRGRIVKWLALRPEAAGPLQPHRIRAGIRPGFNPGPRPNAEVSPGGNLPGGPPHQPLIGGGGGGHLVVSPSGQGRGQGSRSNKDERPQRHPEAGVHEP